MSVLDFTKTISNGVLEKAKSFKGDWNENDETNPAYIKNRPFYETESKIILLDQDLDFENQYDDIYGWEGTVAFQEFIIGQSYTVFWDNEVYSNLICFNDDGPTIGAAYSDFFSTYPFSIIAEDGWIYIYTNSTENSHTIKITTAQSKIVKIDKKYLPEYLSDIIGKSTTGIEYKLYDEFNDNYYTVIAGEGAEIFNDYTDNIASGNYSHAEGANTIAAGNYSHAEGGYTNALGKYSHAEGGSTTASGEASHAEGNSTSALGPYSHAEGYYTVASNSRSHAEGYHTKASGGNQHVQGKYNIEDTSSTYAHIVGNGTSNSKRSNAHTLDWNGNAWYAGSVEGTAIILSSPNGTRFQITVGNDGILTAIEIEV